MRKRTTRTRQIKSLLIFGILLTLILILIVSTVGKKRFNAPHKFAMEVIGTVQYGITHVATGVKTLWSDYFLLLDVRNENTRLTDRIQKLEALNSSYREAVATNTRLSKLLEMKEILPPPTLTAQIVGKDPSLWFKTIIIDRGSSEGIRKGMPVVTSEGVVGQVMNTSPSYSKILLAIDPNSAIDGLVQNTRVQGMIKGQGEIYNMHYVLKNSEIHEGDRIVTSGLGGVFPKGLPVGKVRKAVKNRRGMFQQIEVDPAVNFSQLEYVIIILTENQLVE